MRSTRESWCEKKGCNKWFWKVELGPACWVNQLPIEIESARCSGADQQEFSSCWLRASRRLEARDALACQACLGRGFSVVWFVRRSAWSSAFRALAMEDVDDHRDYTVLMCKFLALFFKLLLFKITVPNTLQTMLRLGTNNSNTGLGLCQSYLGFCSLFCTLYE
jgi:hypothetical protein